MTDVIGTKTFEDWYMALGDADTKAVGRGVGLLEARGVHLPYPYSSAIEGASFRLRELRIQSQGRPIRVFYAFDPQRQAVLLLGGDKTGNDRFYETYVPKAERLWREYLETTEVRR